MNQELMVREMEEYFRHTLEPIRPEFGNLPACPFVKHERITDQILYVACEMRAPEPTPQLIEAVKSFRGRTTQHKTLLVVDTEKHISVDDLVTLGVRLCEECRHERMIAIAVHPDDPFEVQGYKTRGVPFVTMLCQEVEYITWAKDELRRRNYYANWEKSLLDYNFVQIGQFL